MSSFRLQQKQTTRGFTLLLAILIGVVVLTIGVTILNSALKQQFLTEVALESERAFHASYAGVECAQYWNVADVWDVGTSSQAIRCMEQQANTVTVYSNASVGEGTSNANEIKTIEFDWTNADSYNSSAPDAYTYEMCTRMTVYKYFNPGATEQVDALPVVVTGPIRTCAVGVECTVVESRGFNRSCANVSDIRTVEREVTVRF